ncbi:MAG TPA: aldo/keto reductase, partial [Acholeplasmataceae bacterium]|nr:aldo/keto reductase [Acholeplasmataceae bacterium]
MKTIQDVYVLKNGVKMPKVGFGTWQIPDGDICYNAVGMALKHGYRHIDTAAAYGNEASVGKAIKDSGLAREEVFVTSKLQSHIKTYQGALDAFDKTMKELDMDYLDLYLIHAPWPWNEIGKDCSSGNVEAFKAMEKLYREGKIRAIGVSNFSPSDLDNILKHCEIIPHVNQIAFFIGNNQEETHRYCNDKGILIEAYSPLAIGYALTNETIQNMAKTYGVTPAQLCIRYCIEKGTAPLPKSTH